MLFLVLEDPARAPPSARAANIHTLIRPNSVRMPRTTTTENAIPLNALDDIGLDLSDPLT